MRPYTVAALAVAISLVAAGCGGRPSGESTAEPTATAATPSAGQVLEILEPANSATVSEASVIVRGHAPANARVIRDLRLATDEDTITDPTGSWAMIVELREGPNQLRFRIGDDDSTAVDWILIYVPAVAAATATEAATPTPEPTPTATATSTATSTTTATTTATPSATATATATPTAKPSSTPEPQPAAFEFWDDEYSVPDEIPPGTYRTLWSADGCYWARLSGFSGELSDIIANSFGDGYQVVTIKAKDRGFESSGCDVWTDDLSQVTDDNTHFGEGTFIVGTDMRAGSYRSSEGDGCYWARLKGFGGTLGEIIANDFRSSGRATVTIRASDKGFHSSGCGDWAPN